MVGWGPGNAALAVTDLAWQLALAAVSAVFATAAYRFHEEKQRLDEDVYGPLYDEAESLLRGYATVESIEVDDYPYRDDLFRTRWDDVDESRRRRVPATTRRLADDYAALMARLNELESAKRDTCRNMTPGALEAYYTVSLALPVLLTTDDDEALRRELLAYAETTDHRYAARAARWWREDAAFGERLRREMDGETPVGGRYSHYWRTFERQQELYRRLTDKTATLRSELEGELRRSFLHYGAWRLWRVVSGPLRRRGRATPDG